jgi:hypothetical protein
VEADYKDTTVSDSIALSDAFAFMGDTPTLSIENGTHSLTLQVNWVSLNQPFDFSKLRLE